MKILFAALKYDYGIKARGESLEYKAFYPAFKCNAEFLVPFWLEDNGFPNDLISMQSKLLQFAREENPNIVFFMLMENELFPETLLKLKNNYLTINWFCDDAWRFNNYTKHIAEYFTYSITVDKYSILKYHEFGFSNVILSQWAAFDYVENIDFSKIDYKYEVSFIGSKNPTREWTINYLKSHNINVECFGSGWKNGKVSYEIMKDIFLYSKINLNLSNSVSNDVRYIKYLTIKLFLTFLQIPLKHPLKSIRNLKFYISSFKYFIFSKKRVETIKARNFEIPGCGGFQLSQFALEIEDYYRIGKEISIFSNIEELKKQIDYYLLFQEEREQIRNSGYLRTNQQTYDKRINKILQSLI